MSDVDKIQREVESAVEAAIRYGISVEDFRRSCAEMWGAVLEDKARNDARAWREAP